MTEINRVKSLSKSGNSKKDQVPSSLPPASKDVSSSTSMAVSADVDDVYEQHREVKLVDVVRRVIAEKENLSYSHTADFDKQPSSYSFNGQDEGGPASSVMDKERVDMKTTFVGSTSQKMYSSSLPQNSVDTEEKAQKVSPPCRKSEKSGSLMKKVGSSSELSTIYKQQSISNSNTNNFGSKQYEPEMLPSDGNINEILEVGYKCGAIIHWF